VIKPVVEMLAAVPTVIIGFLAAVWLAPQLKDRIPGLLLWLLVTPLVALALGAMFSRIPRRWRAALRSGWEFLVFLPVLLALGVSCWLLSPVLDEWFFQVRPLPEAEKVADFQLWWQVVTGGDFAQQNALIIGFALGLAVLPFIFSLAEDSLSAVPRHLIAGSLALGASRWQTVARVVIPSASAGMFSAFVIGFGRAMGETMIVMMAVANTPILDFSPFTGMRPLSSTIAIELPEAAFGSTLYRTLFLGAAALFLITFVANTLAEVLRNSLRRNLKSSR
jgi:phosphate transport system permease protein